MKRAMIGGFISLIGSILLAAFIIRVTNLPLPLWWISIVLIVLGVVIMAFEFFKKE